MPNHLRVEGAYLAPLENLLGCVGAVVLLVQLPARGVTHRCQIHSGKSRIKAGSTEDFPCRLEAHVDRSGHIRLRQDRNGRL